MKITKEIWLKATAEAMLTDGCKELFESEPNVEELFTDYAFHLLLTLSGKTLDRPEFIQTVGDISREVLSEVGMGMTNVLVNLALMCFASQIWDNLMKLTETDRVNAEYEKFRSVLKSQKAE